MLLATTDVSYSGGYLSPAEQQQTWSPDFYARSKQTLEKEKDKTNIQEFSHLKARKINFWVTWLIEYLFLPGTYRILIDLMLQLWQLMKV